MVTNNAINVGTVPTGQVLVSAGTGVAPVWSATPNVTSITFGAGSALNNYSTGTFTPTITGLTTAGTTTYTFQNGYYIRIGGIVFVQFDCEGSAATGTGNAVLGGLPFTIKNQAHGFPTGSVLLWTGSPNWPWPANTSSIVVYGLAGTTNCEFLCSGSSSGGGTLQMTNAAFNFQGSLAYQI